MPRPGLFRPDADRRRTLLAYRYTAKGFSPVHRRGNARGRERDRLPGPGSRGAAIRWSRSGTPDRLPAWIWIRSPPTRGPYKPIAQIAAGIDLSGAGRLQGLCRGRQSAPNFADPLGLHVDLTAAVYSGRRHRQRRATAHQIGFGVTRRGKLRLKYNATDFYDLFGPTKDEPQGYSAGVRYHQYWSTRTRRPRVHDQRRVLRRSGYAA